MKTKYGALLGLTFCVGLSCAMPARAQVSVNVHIGEPPPVVVYSPPTMVMLPEPQMYVMVGVPYDIYFVSGRYYYLHEGRWFWGPGYRGPWTFATYQSLPPGLRRYKVTKLHEFRDREYRVYQVQGQGFRGGYFVAEEREEREKEHPGRGRGRDKH